MRTHTKYFRVADITIELNSDYSISEKTFHSKFKLFESDEPCKENIVINHHFYLPEDIEQLTAKENPIYEKDQWRIYKAGSFWIYKYTPLLTNDPGKPAVVIFNDSHTLIEVYTTAISKEDYETANLGALTLFNTDQILFAKLLCNLRGLILHANGFDIQGKGILLAGASGVGKSTLSETLKNKGLDVLCDDRMFITKKKNAFWIHGNWCHGSIANVTNISVPLHAIFFLEQAKENSSTKISNRKQKTHQLIQSLVKPFFTSTEWDMTFSTIDDLVRTIECYHLKFDLSGKVYTTIKDVLGLD